MKRYLPSVVLGVFVIYAAAGTFTPVRSRGGFDMSAFGRLPVQLGGRVQPMDTAARIGLLQIRGSVDVPLERTNIWRVWHRTDRLEPAEWIAEVLMDPAVADARPLFAVQDPTIIQKLQLKAPSTGTAYYAFNDLHSSLDAIGKETARIVKLPPAKRTTWERAWLRLRNSLVVYERLKNSLQPNSFIEGAGGGKHPPYDFAARLAEYQAGLRVGVKAAIAREHGKQEMLDNQTEDAMRAFARPYVGAARVALLKVIPPADVTNARDRWEDVGTAIVNSARTGQLPASVSQFAAMSSAFTQGKRAEFNSELTKYRQWLASKGMGAEAARARYEFLYNRAQPYVRTTGIYVAAVLVLMLGAFRRSRESSHIGAMLVSLACVLQMVGLLFEMMVEGRPPITNVYSRIIFGGWVAVVAGCIAHRVWQRSAIMIGTGVTGLLALAIAHSLAPGGIVQLTRSALDATFWAASITAGAALLIIERRVMTLYGATGADAPLAERTAPMADSVEIDAADVVTTA